MYHIHTEAPMAIIKYGHLISEARGKLNGTVFSRNTYGAYMRTKVTPANPQTTYQQNVRTLLTAAAQAWRALTATQRTAWNATATIFARRNIFGDSVPLTGFNLFVRLYRNAQTIGATPLTEPPLQTSVQGITSFTCSSSAAASSLNLAFAPAPVPTNTAYLVYATQQLSAGISFAGGAFRHLTTLAPATTSPSDEGTAYETRFDLS